MSIGADLGQYCANTQFKKYEDSMGVWTPYPWVRQWQQHGIPPTWQRYLELLLRE